MLSLKWRRMKLVRRTGKKVGRMILDAERCSSTVIDGS
jgi:hypothetical protein